MRLPIHSSLVRRASVLVLVLGFVMVAGAIALAQRADATTTTLQTFTTPGGYTWTVPTGVTNATFDVFGASGGNVVSVNHGVVTVVSAGGAGGEAKAKFAVRPGEKFRIFVGARGGTATLGTTTANHGYNGGGDGSVDYSGAGGGGSDVRLPGRGDTCITANYLCNYGDRIVVGGGGSGGGATGTDGANGGGLNGGGFSAQDGLLTGGGTDFGGECSPNGDIGEFGLGAAGYGYGGGAGGGWYGGCSLGDGGQAGGGSGYISPFAKSGSFPGGLNQGDGKVIITTTT